MFGDDAMAINIPFDIAPSGLSEEINPFQRCGDAIAIGYPAPSGLGCIIAYSRWGDAHHFGI